MQLNDFHVLIKHDPNLIKKAYRIVHYGDDWKDTEPGVTVTEVDQTDWTIAEWAEIASSLLEDVNAHKYCNKIHDIIDTMRQTMIPEGYIKAFIIAYTKRLFKQYGY